MKTFTDRVAVITGAGGGLGRAPSLALASRGCHVALAVSLETVRENFSRFGLLDERVRFVKGLFKDTLHEAPIDKLAVLRMDGDMYESTMDTLVALYPKLSAGGYLIIDDHARENCAKAVADYRERHDISEKIVQIDWTGAYWRKE